MNRYTIDIDIDTQTVVIFTGRLFLHIIIPEFQLQALFGRTYCRLTGAVFPVDVDISDAH